MDDWLGLEAKTWRQLAACTYLAMDALKKIDSDEARAALAQIEHALSPAWDGSVTTASS